MCEQCSADTKTYGVVLKEYALVRATRDGNFMKAGDWGLVECNDPTFVFHTMPIKNPTAGMTDEHLESLPKNDPIWKEDDRFIETSEIIGEELVNSLDNPIVSKSCHIWACGKLWESMKSSGFNPDVDGSSGIFWLCDYLARFMEEHPEPIKE